jgi:hypothetical protein
MAATPLLEQVRERARQLASALPTNRAYLDGLHRDGSAAVAPREAV